MAEGGAVVQKKDTERKEERGGKKIRCHRVNGQTGILTRDGQREDSSQLTEMPLRPKESLVEREPIATTLRCVFILPLLSETPSRRCGTPILLLSFPRLNSRQTILRISSEKKRKREEQEGGAKQEKKGRKPGINKEGR